MPSTTPQELQEAKRRHGEERRQEAERIHLEAERRQVEAANRRDHESELQARHSALASYVGGIYDEVSKLSTKRSSDEVSERMLNRANRAIRDARGLLAGENDPYIDEIEEFIPAGDPVEARDVVLTPRQVKDALDRMRSRHSRYWY